MGVNPRAKHQEREPLPQPQLAGLFLSVAFTCPLQGPVLSSLESLRQADVEAAFVAGRLDVLAKAHREVDYLFPRAIERVFVEQALRADDQAQAWIELCEAIEWGEAAALAMGRVQALATASNYPVIQVELMHLREALQVLDGQCDPKLRKATRRRAAEVYREIGLPALAYEQEVGVLEAIVDGETVDLVSVAVDSLLSKLEGGAFPLAQLETEYRRGQVLGARFRNDEARVVYEAILDRVRACPDSRLLVQTCDLLGWVHYVSNRTELGDSLFAEGESAARARQDWNRVARILRSRAQVSRSLGYVEQSEAQYREALTIALNAGLEGRAASVAIRYATSLGKYDRFDEARENLAHAERLLGGEMADLCGAESRFSRMLQARFLQVKIDMEMEADPDGFVLSDQARETCRVLMGTDLAEVDLFGMRLALARYLGKRGEQDEAIAIVKVLQQHARENRLYGYVTTSARLLASLLAEKGETEQAFRQLEGALASWDKLRVGLDGANALARVELGRGVGDTSSSAVRIAYDVWRAAEPGSSEKAHTGRVALAFAGYGRAFTALEELDPERKLDPFDLDAAIEEQGRILEPGDVVFVFDSRSGLAVVATAGDVLIYEIPDRETVDVWVERGVHALRYTRPAERYGAYTAEMTRALLGPALPFISASQRVLWLADGPLARQPLELLFHPRDVEAWERGGEALGLGELPYLVRTHTVVYLASLREASTLVSPDEEERNSNRVALFAHPQGPNGEALPGVAAEAQALRELYAPELIDVSFGEAASESALASLRSGEYGVLHLACHLCGDPNSKDRAWVQLAPEEGSDGRVTIEEIAAMDLALDLVVLSGCSAAEGIDGGTEGLVSLGWGCLCAGAKSLILSAFDVRDSWTQHLMVAVHRELIAGKAPEVALRDARLALLESGEEEAVHAALLPFLSLRVGY